MSTNHLYKLESAIRGESYWVPDPVIQNPISDSGDDSLVIPPTGDLQSFGSSSGSGSPPSPPSGGGGGGGDNPEYMYLSDLIEELINGEYTSSNGDTIIIDDLPPE